jgi:hypothetical protein
MYQEIDSNTGASLSVHCAENSKEIFPKMKLCGLTPNFYIHVPVSDLYSSIIGPPILMYCVCGRGGKHCQPSGDINSLEKQG